MLAMCAIDRCSGHIVNLCLSIINMFGVCAIDRCRGLNNCVENVILIIVNLALYHFMAVPYECIYI